MNIYLVTAIGYGKTLLSSFDSALFDAGISNYNLIVLSSVIPPGTKIIKKKYSTPVTEYGHRLYVVMSDNRSQDTGKYIGSALGWYQQPDGRGVFVEHHTSQNSKAAVSSRLKKDVEMSLSDLCHQRKYSFTPKMVNIKMSITKVTDKPTSVLVIAVYKSEPWDNSK